MVHERKAMDAANFTAVLVEEIATATQTFSTHQPDESAAINMEARLSTSHVK